MQLESAEGDWLDLGLFVVELVFGVAGLGICTSRRSFRWLWSRCFRSKGSRAILGIVWIWSREFAGRRMRYSRQVWCSLSCFWGTSLHDAYWSYTLHRYSMIWDNLHSFLRIIHSVSFWLLLSEGSRWSWVGWRDMFWFISYGWWGWGSIVGWCWNRGCIASCAWGRQLVFRKRWFGGVCFRLGCGGVSRRVGKIVCIAWIRIIWGRGWGGRWGFIGIICCLCWDRLKGLGTDTFAFSILLLEVFCRFCFNLAKYTSITVLRYMLQDRFWVI